MTKGEAIILFMNISADIGKVEHQDLWHYEQALFEIREMLEAEVQFSEESTTKDTTFGEWIPVSERLPEDVPEGFSRPRAIICNKWGDIDYGYYANGAKLWVTETGYFKKNIIAWMPLPKPYQRGEQDE